METRSWPNDTHQDILTNGSLDQLDNLYAFLPGAETGEQKLFILRLFLIIQEKRQTRL